MQRNDELYDDVDHPKTIHNHSKWPNTRDILSKIKFGSIMASIFGNGKSRMGYCYRVRRSDGCSHSRKSFASNSSKMQSFSSFFQNRARPSFTRGKTSETKTSIVEICDHINHLRLASMENHDGNNNGDAARDFGWGRQASKSNLPRVPSRIMTTRHRLKMSRSLRKMSSRRIEMKAQQNGEDEKLEYSSSGTEELCKKRILLGGKCRPFNHSGRLNYGEDGILLADIIP